MRVAILAAGYGTRLYPLTVNLPKPLIPVCSTPIINFLIEKIKCLNNYFPVEEIRVVSNNKFYPNFLEWKKKYHFDVNIINDGSNSPEDRLGAIGDINFAIGRDVGDWLILGGDNLFNDALIKFMRFACKKKPYVSIGLYKLAQKKLASNFGVVKLNLTRKISIFLEKPENPPSRLIATCVYFFPKDSLEMLNRYISARCHSDASGKYIEWLVQEARVYGYPLKGSWFDIGRYESLKSAEEEFKKIKK
jgi:glucose-1-phosphate thymidylyltransferase